MPPLGFDEELDSLTSLAPAVPPADRSSFLQQVAGKLATHPAESRGPGLLHRIATKVQRGFLRTDQVAVGTGPGGKYRRATHLRERRRRSSA